MVSSKGVLFVVAPDMFRDEEFIHPKEVLESAGVRVFVASKGVNVAKGRFGAAVKVDIDISKAKASDYDAVIFVGGPGAAIYFNDSAAIRLAEDAYKRCKVLAAICIAPSILANAGVLKLHKATCFPSEEPNVSVKSKEYTGKDVEVDGTIITANGPSAARKFGQEILRMLG